MKTLSVDDFVAASKVQSPESWMDVVVRCPMCETLQSARDLIAAGAGGDLEAVGRYLGFSCIGRFTGAPSPRKVPDGKPCNWTLGGLLRTHTLEVITPDGKAHPHFELAEVHEAEAHRASQLGTTA